MGLWNINILHFNLQDFVGFWAQLYGLGGLRANFQTHLGINHNSPMCVYIYIYIYIYI